MAKKTTERNARTKAELPQPKRNTNGRPVLKKNTIKQAEKPSKAPITLPSAPGILPDFNEIDELREALEAKTAECLSEQEKFATLKRKYDRLFDKATRLRGALSKFGVSADLST